MLGRPRTLKPCTRIHLRVVIPWVLLLICFIRSGYRSPECRLPAPTPPPLPAPVPPALSTATRPPPPHVLSMFFNSLFGRSPTKQIPAPTQPPLAHPRVTELPGSVPVFPATDLSLQDSAVASQNKQFVQHHLLREGSDAQYLSFLLQFRAVEEPKSWSHRHLEPKEFLLISLAQLLPRSTGINQHTATLTSCFVSDCINTCHTVPLPNR